MMFQTHLVFSLLIGLFLMNYFSQKYLFLGLLLVGSLLPDIDSPYSKLGKKLKPVSKIIKFIFGHRGFFHSVIPGILIYVIFRYILNMKLIGIALLIGYLLHLVIDGLTKEGVNYFYPFAKFRMSGFIKTGGVLEWLIFSVLVFLVVVKVIL